MKELQLQRKSDLPANFLQKVWIAAGADFNSFLSQFKAHDLFFSVEVPDEDLDNDAASNAIDEQLQGIALRGGPKLPGPGGDPQRRWEYLSCRVVNVKMRDLRGGGRQGGGEKMGVVEIKTSSKMLAPLDYKVKAITKHLGFKNTLRESEDEPEKFVVIG